MVRALSFALLFALAPAGAALALPPDQVAKRGLDAVVTVRATIGSQTRSGSGVLIERDVLATLASTVTGADKVEFRRVSEKEWKAVAAPIGTDRKNDIILFTLPKKERVRAPRLANKRPGIGAQVYAVSAPLKSEGSFHRGLVSGVVQKRGRSLVQMDAHVDDGSRGGALLDDQARLVGLLVDDVSDEKFTYALSVELVRALRDDPKSIDPFAGVDPGAADAYRAGVEAAKNKRPEEAAKRFREAIDKDASLIRARHRLARALANAGDLAGAVKELELYLEEQPDDLDARYELGENERVRGNLAAAFGHFQKYAESEKRESRQPYVKHASAWQKRLTKSYERRAVVMPTVGDEERTRTVKQRLKGKTSLELIEPGEIDAAFLPEKKGEACREDPTCIWRPAWARWVVTSEAVDAEEGVALGLALFDVREQKKVAEVEVQSTGDNQLPLDIDDQLPALLESLPDGLKKAGAVVATAEDGEAPQRSRLVLGEIADEGDEPVADEGAGGLGARGSGASEEPKERATLRDEEPEETRRVAIAEEEASSSFNVMPLLLIGTGVTVAGAGVAFDLLSPWSGDYRVDAFDFIGPGIIAVGLVTGVAGFFFFGGEDEEG